MADEGLDYDKNGLNRQITILDSENHPVQSDSQMHYSFNHEAYHQCSLTKDIQEDPVLLLLAKAITSIFAFLMFCLTCVCWRHRKLANEYEEIAGKERGVEEGDGIVRAERVVGNVARRRIIPDPETHGVLSHEEREAQELTEMELRDCNIEFD